MNGYSESQQQIDSRWARILARPRQYTHSELIAKSKQLQAAIKAELQKPVQPYPAPKTCAGAMVFPLESGGYFCMNCGGNHE